MIRANFLSAILFSIGILNHDFLTIWHQKGIKTILISGDREEAVEPIAKTIGIEHEFVNAALTPQQKSRVISTLQTAGHHIAMTEAQETAASDAASIILLGNRLSQVVDALDLAQATMTKVYQNLSWEVAYNIVPIPIAASVLLPQHDLAMTPSFSASRDDITSTIPLAKSCNEYTAQLELFTRIIPDKDKLWCKFSF
ncbi:hypothetical protein J1N35_000545 [Gossypium stocksii]|uniref:Uncharacterized protein n=1 Tax=Gossypium stocksii TaxID=47602 RepID=A0A9D4AK70_9ROSI|nr:hypothetical protein J1N35_000545 [Gossypium stocksii]